MTKHFFVYIWLSFFIFQASNAQEIKDSLRVQFDLRFKDKPLVFNQKYISSNQDTLAVDLVKFYVSQLQVEYADHSVDTDPKKYHLVDFENPTTATFPVIPHQVKPITKISFYVGIDSTASVSGALSGDLDPTKGMYWAWQSGYINMKIEGKSNSCKTRNHRFQYHIGGYQKPNNALRKIVISTHTTAAKLTIAVDLAALFATLHLNQSNSIMMPGKPAMEVANTFNQLFKIE